MISHTALYAPKEGSALAEYEDAFAFAAESSVAALADGAGSAFESRRWAGLLTKAFADNPPFGLTESEMLGWTDRVSSQWSARIPWQTLDYYQTERVTEGSAATLVGLRLEGPTAGIRTWHCMAIGDSCMFLVSAAGHCVESIPITRSSQFNVRPPLLYTQRETTEQFIGKLVSRTGQWKPGDSFFLLTDAMSEWFLRMVEQGGKPWDTLTSLDQESFGAFVAGERRNGRIQNDDLTVLMVRTEVSDVPQPSYSRSGMPSVKAGEPVLVGGSAPRADGGGRATSRPLRDARTPGPRSAARRAKVPPAGVRRRAAVLAGALALGLLCGLLIGLNTASGSAPPAPVPPRTRTASPTTAIESAARAFGNALVNFDGDLSAYESGLNPYAVPGLANSLPQTFHLNETTFSHAVSHGDVESLTLTEVTASTARASVIISQTLTAGGARAVTQYLPVLLELTRSPGRPGEWRVNNIELLPASDQLFPQPAPAKKASHHTGSKSTKETNG